MNNSINQLINAGYTQEGGLVGGSSFTTTPFDNHLFCRSFTVYKVKKGYINAGEQCVFSISSKKPKYIDMNDYSYGSSQLGTATYTVRHYALKKCTKFIWYRFRGIIGNDSVTKTQATVTRGASTVNWVTEHRYRIRSLCFPTPYNAVLSSTSLGSATIALPTPAVSFDFVADDTDAVQVLALA